MKIKKLPELLAPAGSYDALLAAVEAGADAVYLGGTHFNARANADNFDGESAARGIAYCHLFGVKVYVALNTLLFDREREAFLKTAAAFYRMGVDAAIVADLGAVSLLRRYIPGLPIHISTQASVHSLAGAEAMAALGAERVVLARELSLADIRTVTTHAPCETEIFVHGALCVSHSGQCLLSSMIGGRSGNRGACAQPCRLPYNGKYPLSLRDLSLADHVPALIESGVASLKIEGRMKAPAYVHGVTAIYRRLLDERRCATAAESRRLREIFSRDGFTDGYFVGKHTAPMTGTRREQDKNDTRALAPYTPRTLTLPLTASATVRAGRPATLTLTLPDGRSGRAVGDIPTPARSAPLTPAGLADRFGRLGGTPFTLAAEDLTVEMDEGLNLSPGALNALRRAACAALMAPDPARAGFVLPPFEENGGQIPAEPAADRAVAPGAEPAAIGATATEAEPTADGDFAEHAPPAEPPAPGMAVPKATPACENDALRHARLAGRAGEPLRTALFFDPAVFDGLGEGLDYFDLCFLPLERYTEASARPDGVCLPPVVTDREREAVLTMMRAARADGIVWALVGNPGLVAPARALGFRVMGDFRLNVTNRSAAAAWRAMGVEHLILSPELSLPRLRDMGEGSATVYGRLPLMLLERCFIRENFGCEKCGRAALTDRRGARFPLLRTYPHRNLLLNSLPTYMGEKRDELAAARIGAEHFIFTTETADEAARVLRSYQNGLPLGIPCRGIVKS